MVSELREFNSHAFLSQKSCVRNSVQIWFDIFFKQNDAYTFLRFAAVKLETCAVHWHFENDHPMRIIGCAFVLGYSIFKLSFSLFNVELFLLYPFVFPRKNRHNYLLQTIAHFRVCVDLIYLCKCQLCFCNFKRVLRVLCVRNNLFPRWLIPLFWIVCKPAPSEWLRLLCLSEKFE